MPVQEERSRSTAVHEAWLPAEHPLHRPRHSRRQRTALISALVFFVVPLLALMLGARPARFENRDLASAPSLSDGWGFFTALPAWATDHLPFRDVAVRTVDDVSRGVFGEPAPLAVQPRPNQDSGRHLASERPVVPAVPFAPSPVVIPAVFPPVIEGESGWLYLGSDVEAKCVPARPLDQTIEAVNRLRAAVEASGRRFVLVVPPDKTTAQPEFLPRDYPGRGCAQAGTSTFWSQVTERTGAVDLRGALGELATPEDPIYHRLDTHWTDRGAILMTSVLAEQIRPGVTSSWKIEPGWTHQSDADLPPLIGRTGLKVATLYSLAPSGDLDRTVPHLDDIREPTFLGAGDVPGAVPESVAMLADSFSQPAARYLGAGFADVAIVSYETAGAEPARIGALLAEREVVILEVVERNLAAGIVPVLESGALDAIAAELAARPLN